MTDTNAKMGRNPFEAKKPRSKPPIDPMPESPVANPAPQATFEFAGTSDVGSEKPKKKRKLTSEERLKARKKKSAPPIQGWKLERLSFMRFDGSASPTPQFTLLDLRLKNPLWKGQRSFEVTCLSKLTQRFLTVKLVSAKVLNV